MSHTGEPTAYHTRSAARRGFQAAEQPTNAASTRSSSAGSHGTTRADREPEAPPKSRSVTPELLFSRVVSAPLTPAIEPGTTTSTLGIPRESAEPSELFPLNPATNFGSDESVPWTEVTGKTAHSHRERSASQTSNVSNWTVHLNSNSTSPVLRATSELSPKEFFQLARCYESMARAASQACSQPDGDHNESVRLIAEPPARNRTAATAANGHGMMGKPSIPSVPAAVAAGPTPAPPSVHFSTYEPDCPIG
jgi:hypothetical protein